jgi:threonine synthase
MGRVAHLSCVKCGDTFQPGSCLVCPNCGAEGILEAAYDYDLMRRSLGERPLEGRKDRTIFRYTDMLPVGSAPATILDVGWTPMYRFERLSNRIGLGDLRIKDETVNPSGSLKDRASAVAIALALETGARAVACASTGNAASSLAVLAAATGLECFIFVPRSIPPAKLAQMALSATRVFRVDGTYEDACALADRAIEHWGWYNRNCAINPYLVEGKKTCGLEIYEQLCYSVPDWIVLPVGDGCILSAQGKAFEELRLLGLTDRLPRLLAVQASGCAPLVFLPSTR